MFIIFVISLVLLTLLLVGKAFELSVGRRFFWSTRRQRLDARLTQLTDEVVRYASRFKVRLRNQVYDWVTASRRWLANHFRRLADRLH